MELAGHPLVAGLGKRAGLFWFSISPLFTDAAQGDPHPAYFDRPGLVLEPIWALPDLSLHRLGDAENSPAPLGAADVALPLSVVEKDS